MIKNLAIATLVACGLSAFAPMMPTTALADTYGDNVFRHGEPRSGGKPWLYEDRNVVGMRHHRHMKYNVGAVPPPHIIGYWRRVTRIGVATAAPAQVEQNARIVRHKNGTCSRRGVQCPCPPTSTTAKSSIKQNQKQQITVKNVGAGANVTINAAATQQVGGLGTARATAAASGDCSIAEAGMRMLVKPAAHAIRVRNPNTGKCTWEY